MKQPPLGSVIIDRLGTAWQRTPNGWTTTGSDGSWYYTWKHFLQTEKSDYASDKDKMIYKDQLIPQLRIVYVPNEELILDVED